MTDFISPNDPSLYGKNDSETIKNAIAAAEADGCRKIVIPRYNARTGKNEWRILVSIQVPSHFTILLDNCYMVQETGAYDNMFSSLYAWQPELSSKPENEQTDISIIGQGNVILDGGVHNHLLEKTSKKYRQPRLWRNTMFLWVNVNGLRVENLHIENQRWWAMTHVSCRNVKIKNIDFWAIPHVNNMDGIDLRLGCSNFDIQNITGRTGDDVLAMTALKGDFELPRIVEGGDADIHDVKVRNIKADPNYLFLVRLLNHDGCNIYNIDLDTLMDTSDYTKKKPSGACVNVGSMLYSHVRPCEHGETRYVKAKNLTSRGGHAVRMSRTLSHARFSNIKTFGDNINGVGIDTFCRLEDVEFEHLWYGAHQQEIFCSKDLQPENYKGTMLNMVNTTGEVTFRDVNIDKVKTAVNVSGGVKVTIDGLRSNVVNNQLIKDDKSTVIIDGEVR